jgi:excisionase family DNA binding protein
MGKKISMKTTGDDLGVSKRTVQRLIASGELRAYKVGAKIVRVDADDVAALLKPMHDDLRETGRAALDPKPQAAHGGRE